MRLERPYIPIAVRVQVASRQLRDIGIKSIPGMQATDGRRLQVMLNLLFGDAEYQLHHRPALCNRPSVVRTVKGKPKTFYDPPANDSDHLIYLEKGEHGIETRVRGVGAQRSDLGQRRYLKRVARNRASKTGAKVRRPKVKRAWPSRPFPNQRKS